MTPPDSGRRERDDLDVDARFLLANERTLLAWVRTSLTFLIAGFGVQQFATDLRGRELVAVVLMVLGAFCAGEGVRRYVLSDRALRAGRLPMAGKAPLVVGVGLLFIAVASIVAVVVGAAG